MAKLQLTGPSDSKNSAEMALAAPALVVAFGYVLLLGVRDIPGSTTVNQLQSDLQQLQAAPVDWAEVEVVKQREAALVAEKETAVAALARSRAEAERLGSGRSTSSLPTMAVLGRLTNILENHRLVTSSVSRFSDSGRPKLLGTIDRSTRDLQTAIQKANAQPTGPGGTPYRPEGMPPPGMSLEDFIASQQQQNASFLSGPPLVLTEILARGSYHNLLAALRDIEKECGESVVVGVDFRRLVDMAGRSSLDIQLVVNLQPGSDQQPAIRRSSPPADADALLASDTSRAGDRPSRSLP